ncbi:MAG: hypothetical protein QW097_01780 [archaeon]
MAEIDLYSTLVLLLLSAILINAKLTVFGFACALFILLISRSFAISLVCWLALASIYFLNLKENWFIPIIIAVAIIYILAQRKGIKHTEEGGYDELLRMLGGYR